MTLIGCIAENDMVQNTAKPVNIRPGGCWTKPIRIGLFGSQVGRSTDQRVKHIVLLRRYLCGGKRGMATHEEHFFKRFCNDDVAGLEVQVKYVIRVYEVDGFAHLKEPAAATPKRASFPKRAVAFGTGFYADQLYGGAAP